MFFLDGSNFPYFELSANSSVEINVLYLVLRLASQLLSSQVSSPLLMVTLTHTHTQKTPRKNGSISGYQIT